MRFRDERKVFKEILNCPIETIPTIFSVKDDGICYTFFETAHPTHYITVDKTKGDSFWVPVNADFGFDRPAGSNNYRELIDVARHLVSAFELKLNWLLNGN